MHKGLIRPKGGAELLARRGAAELHRCPDFGFFGQSTLRGPLSPQYLEFFELADFEDEFDQRRG
jgi:hypothetical protein